MSAAAIIVAGIALIYLVALDVHLTRRCDALSEALDLTNGETDRTVIRVSYLEDATRTGDTGAVMGREAAVRLCAPPTAPIHLVGRAEGASDGDGALRGSDWRTDTAPAEAVVSDVVGALIGNYRRDERFVGSGLEEREVGGRTFQFRAEVQP